MTLLHEAVDFKKMDVRMIERNIARGVVSSDEVEKSLKKLPDDSENADWVSVDSLIGNPDEELPNGAGSSSVTSH